jgi:hypothetical protein
LRGATHELSTSEKELKQESGTDSGK